VRVQLTSSNSYSTLTSATLNIGGVNGTFYITTTAATQAAPVPALGIWGMLAAATVLGGYVSRRQRKL
jgi:hypothetical protein